MRTARLLPCMVLTVVAASAVSATSWPDPAINPFQTLPSPYPTEFQDYSQLFARILADRALSRWFDESLLQRIQADSRIDRMHDRSPEPIDVVRVDLRNPDGTSRVRSKNGDFPFYVLRETPKGLVLMGQMFGSAYRSYIRGQHLEFRVEQHLSVNKTMKMRFRVEDDVLVDLSAPDLKWRPSVANGIAQRVSLDSATGLRQAPTVECKEQFANEEDMDVRNPVCGGGRYAVSGTCGTAGFSRRG